MNPELTPLTTPDVEQVLVALNYAAGGNLPGRGNAAIWTIAFLFFPYGPFVYLAFLKALQWPVAIVLLLFSAVIQNGIVFALSKTNGVAWQPLLVFALFIIDFGFGRLQFILGERHHVWSKAGVRLWRGMAWFTGILILLDIAAIAMKFLIR